MATNTAASFTNHTGNGTAGPFNISFSYLSEAEVDVTVGGVLKTITTHYTFTSATQITFTSGNEPANGVAIKFQRDTNISAKKVDFADGSVLTEADLDANSDQVLFAQQEITDKLAGIEEGATADQTAAEIRTLVESATDSNVFTDADHTKLNNIEANATQDQTVSEIKNLIATSPLDASHLAANSVDTSELVDNAVTNAKMADNAITTSKLLNGNVTETKLANNAVTNAKIKAGAVQNDSLGADAVTTAKIAADAINSTKIADNSIDSEHYVDGSIDTQHIADNQITTNKIVTNAVTADKIGPSAVVTAGIVDANVTTAKLADNAVTTGKIADAELKTLAGMQSGTASKLADSTALTADLADLNQLDGMAKQTTITDDDTKFPTSGAVVDFVAAQIAPLGGLEVVATDAAFPNTQPSAGVVISISDAGGVAFNGSGTSTTARTVGGSTVTINNAPSSLNNETLVAGVGLMVSSTGSGQIYNYHKILGKEDDIKQLSDDINDFNARYRVGSSNPTSALDAGDLFFNTSTSKLLVYNATNSAWEEAQSIGNFFISTLSPAFDGSTQDFTITNAPANVQQIILSINGVVQKPNSGTSTPSEGFALSGSTLKLAAAPPTGSDYFAIVLGSTVNIGTPSNNTVTTAILQNGSVTTTKIVDDAVTTAKIADDAVTNAQLSTGCVSTNQIANGAILNADINASAAIDGTKINPNFGSQAITGTTGTFTSGTIALGTADSSSAHINSFELMTFNIDSDNDDTNRYFAFYKNGSNGSGTELFKIEESGQATVTGNLDVSSGLDVTGADLTVSGGHDLTVQGGGAINGTGNLTIDTNTFHVDSANNRVGIGTISPSNLLDVRGSSHSKILIGTTGTSHATGLQISHAIGDGGLQEWQLQTDATADGNLLIRNATTGNKVMIFDSDVYGVSIGGIDPEKMFELQGSNHGVTDPKSSVNTLRFRCNDSTTTNNQPMGTILWTTNDSGNSSGNAAFITTIDADQTGNGILLFGAGNEAAEKARLDGNGRFFIGTTDVGGGLGGVRLRNPDQGTSRFGIAGSGQVTYIQFLNNNGNSVTGSISGNASSTSFNTSSDYRLKENESLISDGIKRLKQLKPYKFNWKSDSSTIVDGFFAHEVSSIVPESITGTKDAVAVQEDVDKGIADAIGEPIYQTIDHAKLVPLLTAALQEAIAKIETLETKVAALEAA